MAETITAIIHDYRKKSRRYYNLLTKKHKLVPESLLDGSMEGVHQYCQLDESVEMKLNLEKARQQFHETKNELIQFGCDSGKYDLGNEFVREVIVDRILATHS